VAPTPASIRAHRRRSFAGRDPDEEHRTATPLELLYDLTLVVAFGTAANELARYLADGRVRTAILGFAIASFAVAWAWINYSWFASAYDTDDWVMRLATMVQMLGVIVVALGLHQLFASIDEGGDIDNRVMVVGYVVMRVPMIFLWARAARDDPARRPAAITYIWTIAVAQVFWIALAIVALPIGPTLALFAVFVGVEMIGPFVAERRKGGTPWHAHHIAERYGLLVIITLGEGIIGTVASINAVVHGEAGWTVQAGVVAFAGIGLIFATWWTYFLIPWARILSAHRERSFLWGYGHLLGLRLTRGDRRRAPRRRLLPRTSDDAGAGRNRPQHSDPVCDLHSRAVRPLRGVHATCGPVPPGTRGRHHGRSRALGRAGRARFQSRHVPAGADVRAGRERGRL
jgi:low temperature requirement protein LtrA